jgi:DNA-binding response OmpR family regulator
MCSLRAFEAEFSDIESESDFGMKPIQLIIGVSANGTNDVREDALHSGMSDFFPKPFSLKGLTLVQQARSKNNHKMENKSSTQEDLFMGGWD